MRFLKQNTAVNVTVGPFLAYDDGVTPLDALTTTGIAGVVSYDDDDGSVGAHFAFTGSASGGDNDLVAVGHCGMWTLELTAAQTNYTGRMMLCLTDADQICPVFHEFQVLAANIYDSLYAGVGPTADLLDVNVAQWLGTAAHAATVAGVPVVQVHASDAGGGINAPANFEDLSIVDTTGLVATAATQHVIVDSGTVTTVTNQLTAAAIATGVWQDATAGDFTAASSIGKSLFTSGVVPGGAGGLFIAGTNAATVITTSLTTHFIGTVDTCTTLTNWEKTGYALSATGADLILKTSTFALALADAVLDEPNTSSDHAVADSVGLYLRNLYQTIVTRIAQCAKAGTGTTIILDASASQVADFYKGQVIAIVGGVGAGQARACTGYAIVGGDETATIGPAWATNPDATSWFAILNVGSTVVSAIDNIDFSALMKTSLNAATPASVTGAVGSVTGAVGSVTGNVGGSVASVTGAVGSVTGNVGGSVASVTGAVGSVTGAVGSVTGNVGGSVASVTGAVGSVTGNVGGSVASVTGAVGSVTGNIGGSVASVTGAVGSVTGAVASVTGAVGSVTGAVGSVGSGGITAASFAAGAIDATAIKDGAIDAATFAASALDGVWSVAARTITGGTIGTYTGNTPQTGDSYSTVTNATYGLSALHTDIAAIDVSGVAEAVWDELLAGHADPGSAGEALSAAGSAGDPWLTALPGAYTAGTAGNIIGSLLAALSGSGDIEVDHDTGGADNLRAVEGSSGVDGVTVRAYIKTEYDAGTFTIRGEATTGTDGRWIAPMYLDADTYTFVFTKPGVYAVSTKEQAVA